MDLILKNANILTMARKKPRAEALAIRFDRIHRVGTTADLERLAGPRTRVIDLGGRTVLPGFTSQLLSR